MLSCADSNGYGVPNQAYSHQNPTFSRPRVARAGPTSPDCTRNRHQSFTLMPPPGGICGGNHEESRIVSDRSTSSISKTLTAGGSVGRWVVSGPAGPILRGTVTVSAGFPFTLGGARLPPSRHREGSRYFATLSMTCFVPRRRSVLRRSYHVPDFRGGRIRRLPPWAEIRYTGRFPSSPQ